MDPDRWLYAIAVSVLATRGFGLAFGASAALVAAGAVVVVATRGLSSPTDRRSAAATTD